MNNGLVSPIIEGRPDFNSTSKSCRQELNVISTVYGSAFNRGGTVFVGNTKIDTDRFILIPFVVGERVSYVLEFGDRYMRVYRYHDRVMLDNAIYEIETPYTLEDFFDEEGRTYFDYKQSADVLYIVHEKYAPVKLLRYNDTNWTFVDVQFNNGPWQNMNTNKDLVIKAVGGNTGAVTLSTYTGENPVARFGYISSGSAGNTYAVNIKFYTGGHSGAGTVLAERTWTYPVPRNTWAQLAAQLINSLPQFIATNPTTTTLNVTAVSNQSDYSSTQCSVYVGVVDNIGNLRSAFNNATFDAVYSAIDLFTQDWVGRRIRVTQIDTVVLGWHANWNVSAGELCRSGKNYYVAESGGTTGGQMPTHIEGIESDGGIAWKYLHSGYGSVEVTEYISSTQIKAKVLDYIPNGIIDNGTWQWEFSLLDRVTNVWPCAVDFFKDRLCFGVNLPSGPTIVFSVAGDYENFADIDHGEQLPESAMNLRIFTDLNKITWLCTNKNLYVGTEGSIVMVYPISTNEVFGPNNITYEEVSSVGSCHVKPIKMDGDILYLGPKGTSIHMVEYNYSTDSYVPIDLSLLAKAHIEIGITGWAVQYEPNRMIYALRGDGKILGFVYNKVQEVRAFNILETNGTFEAICTIPNAEEGIDEVWAGIKRDINNQTKRYIEYFSLGMPIKIPAEYATDKEKLEYLLDKALFLDCAKEFLFDTPVDIVSGLAHLEGMHVSVVIDNKDVSLAVQDGSITLPFSGKHIKVGLPYVSILEPMPIMQNIENGSGIGRVQRISSIIARLYRTHSFMYGPSLDKLSTAEVNKLYDDTQVLKSGDLKLDWSDSTTDQKLDNSEIVDSTGARMLFVQNRPFPVHWSAFSVAVGISEGIK